MALQHLDVNTGRRLRIEARSSLTQSTEARIHRYRHSLNHPGHQLSGRPMIVSPLREVHVNRVMSLSTPVGTRGTGNRKIWVCWWIPD